jgi:hypothetical protein
MRAQIGPSEATVSACPQCTLENGARAGECARCGLVLARRRARGASAPSAEARSAGRRQALLDEPARPDGAPGTGRAGWLAFGGGLLAAAIALQLWPARAALAAFATLVHEMGHATLGWLYGYPSLPAFDFRYGGGVTLHRERSWLVLGAIVAASLGALRALHAHPRLRGACAALLALHVGVALTPAHDAVILAMGHGAELAFATLALHRALSGRACQLEAERPLYGLVGWFLVLQGLQFAWQLRTSAAQRALYAEAKGGGHWMDFSRLATEYLQLPLESVATGFLLCCLAPPLLALAVAHLRRA